MMNEDYCKDCEEDLNNCHCDYCDECNELIADGCMCEYCDDCGELWYYCVCDLDKENVADTFRPMNAFDRARWLKSLGKVCLYKDD